MQALKKDVEERPEDYSSERAQRFKVSKSGIRSANYL
jgi:hypothetical protein